MKISKDLEELFDLESARIANTIPDEDEPQEVSKADEQLKGQLLLQNYYNNVKSDSRLD